MIKSNCFILAILVMVIHAQADFGTVGDVQSISPPMCSYDKALRTCSGICRGDQCCQNTGALDILGNPVCKCSAC